MLSKSREEKKAEAPPTPARQCFRPRHCPFSAQPAPVASVGKQTHRKQERPFSSALVNVWKCLVETKPSDGPPTAAGPCGALSPWGKAAGQGRTTAGVVLPLRHPTALLRSLSPPPLQRGHTVPCPDLSSSWHREFPLGWMSVAKHLSRVSWVWARIIPPQPRQRRPQ